MDFAELIIQQEEMEEEDVEDELYKAAGVTAAVMLIGIEEQKRLRALGKHSISVRHGSHG